MNNNLKFEIASKEDKQEILDLYRSLIGSEYCAWTDHYPTEREIDFDLDRDALFVMKDVRGKIVGAISQDLDEAVENLSLWSKKLTPVAEIARVAVSKEYQNQGIARQMMSKLFEVLKGRGYKAVHIMVNKYNVKALASYSKLGYEEVGHTFMYEQDFMCFEKAL